jgi:hypothetical protein
LRRRVAPVLAIGHLEGHAEGFCLGGLATAAAGGQARGGEHR